MLKSPETVLCNALATSPAVSLLIGTKAYPVLAPASASLPFVTWRRAAIEREQTLGLPAGMPRVSVDFSIYAATYQEARKTADAMRAVLDGYGGSFENTTIRQAALQDESDDFVTLAGTDLPPVYQITQRYDVMWSEE